MNAREYAWPLALAAALAVLLVAANQLGVSSRRFAPRQKVHEVTSAQAAYAALRDDGVKGRILVVLDDRAGIVPRTWMATFFDSLADPSVPAPVMSHNLTSDLIYAGIVREVYFVPPASAWQHEFERMSNRPDSLPEANGVRARFYGAPVHVTQTADLPVFSEKVLVYIDSAVGDRYDKPFLASLTDARVADVVVRQAAR